MLLLAVLGGGLYLRSWQQSSAENDQVFTRHDEDHYVTTVQGLLNGQGEMTNFINPSLFSYLLFGAVCVVGGAHCVASGTPWESLVVSATLNPTFITLVGRWTSVCFSLAAAILLYRIGRRLGSGAVGLLAAAALAGNHVHMQRAHLAGNESAVVFFCLLFYLSLQRLLQQPSRARALCSSALLGFAISVKYNAAIFVIPLALVLIANVWRKARETSSSSFTPTLLREFLDPAVLLAPVLVVAAFFAGSPMALVQFDKFWGEFQQQYSFLDEGYTEQDVIAHEVGYLYYLRAFPAANNGLAYGLFCGAGLVGALGAALCRRRLDLLLLVAAVLPAYLFLGRGIFHRMRFLLPVLPLVGLLGALAVVWTLVSLQQRLPRRLGSGRPGAFAAVSAFVGLALLLPPAWANGAAMRYRFGAPHPRGPLLSWAREQVRADQRGVELAHPLRLLPNRRALKRFDYDERSFQEQHTRQMYERLAAQLYAAETLRSLLKQSPTLESLRKRLQRGGYEYLLMTLPSPLFLQLKEVPAVIHHPAIRHCSYWQELTHYLATRPRRGPARSGDGSLTSYLFEL